MQLGKYSVTPLTYDALSYASAFCSERCPQNGIVAIAENTLRIITLDKLGDMFTKRYLRTRYTPTKMIVHPESSYLIVLEKDHN